MMDQMEYLARSTGDQQLHCVVAVDGRLDEERLARAVRLSMDAQPVLGCRFVEHPYRARWVRREDLDSLEHCAVVEAPETDGALWEFVVRPTDPATDPVVSARIFRSATDTLCVKVEHSASDAGGAKEYAYLVMGLYRRLGRDPGFVPAPEPAADRTLHQVYRRLTARQRLAAMRMGLPFRETWSFPFPGRGSVAVAFAVRRAEPEAFEEMRSAGRGLGATVNDTLLAAYYRALFEVLDWQPGKPAAIHLPIDLRRYLPQERAEAVCNCSGQLYPLLERVKGESFEGTLRRVRDLVGSFKERTPGIGGARYIELAARAGMSPSRVMWKMMVRDMEKTGRAHTYLSNMGVLDEEALDPGDAAVTDAFMVSPVMFPPGMLLGASSWGGRLTLTLGYSAAEANAAAVEGFMDALMGELGLLRTEC